MVSQKKIFSSLEVYNQDLGGDSWDYAVRCYLVKQLKLNKINK